MPKERRDRSLSFDRSRASPYRCSSSRATHSSPKISLGTSEDDMKEWEEARCPVCMEHPHNAVLLKCSSHEKGCRPYMCDTSYRHSNCFDQFHKSSADSSSAMTAHQETPHVVTNLSHLRTSDATVADSQDVQDARTEEGLPRTVSAACIDQIPTKLVCPLCRGQVNEWIVIESARNFMNAKSRSCACEDCSFSGTYSDLRKHARTEHPRVRPSEADPERERRWRRLERQRDLGDLLSTLQSSLGEEGGDESIMPIDDGGWLTVFLLIRVFRPGLGSRSSSWSGSSRARAQLSFRRRSTRLWGETYDNETGSPRDDDNESSDGGPGPLRPRRRVRRRTTSENES